MKTVYNNGEAYRLLHVTDEEHYQDAKKNRTYDLVMKRNNLYHFVETIPEAEFEVIEPEDKEAICLPSETKT